MPKKPPATVPTKYAGKWIAWNDDQSKILGSGRTLHDARKAVKTKDGKQPIFAKVPQEDVRFIGLA